MHYYNTIYADDNRVQPMALPTVGFIRLLNAIPNSPNLDVYSYDRIIAKDIPYGEYAGYFPLVVEPHKISIYPVGTKETPILSEVINIREDNISTLAAVGRENNIEFLEIPTANPPTDATKSMIRFAHLSPNSPSVDITLPDGTILFGNVPYKQVTPSIPFDPSVETLQVRLAGTPTVVLPITELKFEPNKSYTLYATGLVGEPPTLETMVAEEPPLQSLILIEGDETTTTTTTTKAPTSISFFNRLYTK